MRKNKPITYQAVCDVYGCEVIFITNCEVESLESVLSKTCKINIEVPLCGENEIAPAGYTINAKMDNGEMVYIVWVAEAADMGSLVHECIHLGMDILASREVDFVSGNGEALTYYVASWFTKFIAHIVEHVKPKKKKSTPAKTPTKKKGATKNKNGN